jgi:uncharacterized protein YjcR
MWIDSGGQMLLKDIAAHFGLGETQIRKWKSEDKWAAELNGNVTNQPKGNVTNPKRKGGQPGNRNAKGNRGGHGGPPGNDKAIKHGFFRRIFPDDEETHAIIDEIQIKSPAEILWENIVIQYTAIARAQRIMYVSDKDDLTKELKRQKQTETGWEEEHELQFAWDKQASFLQAQSRAMATLESLMASYEDLQAEGLKNERRKLELDKMRAEIAKIRGDEDPAEDDGFLEALKGKASEVWADGEAEA